MGATAIAVAASVVIDHTVVGWAGSPSYAAPIKEVLAFHAHHSAVVAIAVGLEALTLPLLPLFVTGLHGLVGRRGGAGADWSRLAVAAGATFSAVTAFYAVLWDGVVLSAGQLTEPSPVLEVAWPMHAAALAWSLPALGATFIGAALATHASRLTPPWQRLLDAPVRRGVRLGSLARVADCDPRTAGARSQQLTVLTTHRPPTLVERHEHFYGDLIHP